MQWLKSSGKQILSEVLCRWLCSLNKIYIINFAPQAKARDLKVACYKFFKSKGTVAFVYEILIKLFCKFSKIIKFLNSEAPWYDFA